MALRVMAVVPDGLGRRAIDWAKDVVSQRRCRGMFEDMEEGGDTV